jgi:hypothetical protein
MKLAVIQQKIFEVRGEKVILDFDLAELYGVETRILNQTVKRNADRFPKDFMPACRQRQVSDQCCRMEGNLIITNCDDGNLA